MRCWSWELDCPKCGHVPMKPEYGYWQVFPNPERRDGLMAKCPKCHYSEEVLPLDAFEESDDEPDDGMDLSPWVQSVTITPDESERP